MRTQWIRKVQSAIEQSQDIPMWGQIPSFPWNHVANALKQTLSLPYFSIDAIHSEWVHGAATLKGLGDHHVLLPLVLSPLSTPCFLALSQDDLNLLCQLLLKQEQSIKSFTDPQYQKGFYRFAMLKIIESLNRLKIYEGLSIKMETASLPEEDSYCIDIKVQLDETHTIIARLICPSSFHQVVLNHFAKKPFDLAHYEGDLDLLMSLNAGKVVLKASDLDRIHTGDFIIMDTCSYQVDRKTGSLTMMLAQTPLFVVKPKEDTLKIIDFALFEEEPQMFDHDDDYKDEDEIEDDEDLEEDDDIEDEEDDEDEEIEEEEEAEDFGKDSLAQSTLEPLIASKNIPLTLHVEVGQIKMPLKKLLSLQPGNTLELKLRPQAGVQLTVNGKVIGRGELLQIGDLLGVKVTEIGKA